MPMGTAPIPSPPPGDLATTRDALHRVAAHVLARRRHALTGRIGLRATPGGFGAPAGGPEHEVVRLSGTWLVRERTGEGSRADLLDLAAASLADAAALVDVQLDDDFSVGRDTPPLGDATAPLGLEAGAVAAVAGWFAFGTEVLDAVVAALGPAAAPSVLQLWPEHFDVGGDVAAAPGRRVNLGASPGDALVPEPYLYVGPWDADRPGDAGYWNVPFGAARTLSELRAADDPQAAGAAFLHRGVDLLR
jgi:hypothetical protein